MNPRPSRREGRAPPGHGGRHGRRPSAPHAGTPGNGGPASTRPRAAPIPGFQVSSSPDRRPHPPEKVPAANPSRGRLPGRRTEKTGESGNLGSCRAFAGLLQVPWIPDLSHGFSDPRSAGVSVNRRPPCRELRRGKGCSGTCSSSPQGAVPRGAALPRHRGRYHRAAAPAERRHLLALRTQKKKKKKKKRASDRFAT